MHTLLSGYIFPHPPIIVPEVGRGEENKASETIEGCIRASEEIKSLKPETIIVITPHGPVFRDAVGISVEKRLTGSFRNFRCPEVRLTFENDIELVQSMLEESANSGIPAVQLKSELLAGFGMEPGLDHGAMVPLYYISKQFSDFKLVHVCMGFLTFDQLFEFGAAIGRAVDKSEKRVVVIASGDLSHRLTPDAPCGYNHRGREFDELFVRLLGEGRFSDVMALEEDLIEDAGECGLRPFTILFGCLKDYGVQPEIFSYEGPFGVGYCVARLAAGDRKLREGGSEGNE